MKFLKKYKYALIISLVSLLILVSIPSSIIGVGLNLPTQFDNTFYGGFKLKVERLKKTNGKRIIIVGGSSVPFGIRSDLIELNFNDYQVVNFGLYANLGTKVMLDIVGNHLRNDDIVIFSPEQHEQTLSTYFNGLDMWKALDGSFQLVNEIASENRANLYANFPNFVGEKYLYSKGEKLDPEGVYNVKSFNKFGDIDYPQRNNNIMNNYYNSQDLVSFSEEIINEDFIKYLNEFNSKSSSKGAKTYYRFASTNKLSLENSDPKVLDNYYQFLDQELMFDILGNPHDSILDHEWFYDTNYHLNASGAITNTLNIVKELKIEFGDGTPVLGTYPLKPPPLINEEEYEENTLDIDYFNYEKRNNGWHVDSLKKEFDKETIYLPTSYANEKIISFDKELFKNSQRVKELVIAPNIHSIDDSSFAFSSIEKIKLLALKPSSTVIGNNLLENSKANIFVAKEVLNNYKLDYSWSAYSNRIFGY
ncbi:MAG TPA: hypothetical protein VJY64_01115 [Candidatus Onthovivens sp.]|nr:hypothetical protein [Candidatus Onthovivens sp.]